MPKRLANRGLQILKVDRLGHEVECAAIHRGANIRHVAIGRHNDGRKFLVVFLQLLQ
jgi:hypothetical protein